MHKHTPHRYRQCLLPPALLYLLAGVATAAGAHETAPAAVDHGESQPQLTVAATPAIAIDAVTTVGQIIPVLTDKRVVFVGEQHARYDHHLIQLEIIRALHSHDPRLAIGLEMFQQPFQRHLDDYVAGLISEQEMLRATEYYQRWGVDYRLYAPILRFAREQQVPLIALNLPVEITRAVGRGGIEALDEAQRTSLPADIDRSDTRYEARIREVFEHHPNDSGQEFAHFLEVQLLWDEGMAERAAAFLQANPDHRLVVLAGAAHVAYGNGIPARMQRRVAVDTATVLAGWDDVPQPGLADFLLWPTEQSLPEPGRIGALLEEDDDGVKITACVEHSPCAGAGMKAGDRIDAINDAVVTRIADLRLALWDKQPSDKVSVRVVRTRGILPAKTSSHDVTLQ